MTWSKAISLAEYKKMIRKQPKQDRKARRDQARRHVVEMEKADRRAQERRS